MRPGVHERICRPHLCAVLPDAIHHLTPLQTGMTLALLTGVFGFAGTALPGLLSDRWGRGDPRWGIYVAALCIAVSLPFHALFYLATPCRLRWWE